MSFEMNFNFLLVDSEIPRLSILRGLFSTVLGRSASVAW